MGSAIYVLGGVDASAVTGSVLKFDSTQGTWSQVAPMPAARFVFAACAINGVIYVFGGFDSEIGAVQSSVSKYDTVSNEWSTLAPMPYVCKCHSAQVLDGLVYIVGARSG
jgi:N-acetylneuraminic acid mutarotase